MLDAITKLSEKLIELAKYRASRRWRQFASIVEPVYESMLSVHQEYLMLLNSAVRQIETGTPLDQVSTMLGAERAMHQAQRYAVLHQAAALLSDPDLEFAHRFFECVATYFRDGPEISDTPSETVAKMVASARSRLIPGAAADTRQADLLGALRHRLASLQSDWQAISAEYARLKAASVR